MLIMMKMKIWTSWDKQDTKIFFVSQKKGGSKIKSTARDEPEDNSHDDSENDDKEEDNEGFHVQVIEDMSIQINVPAFAMEEIAPVAVSDAAMLAPEEVFAGKGDIKEKEELTQAERKRRRANKKRKYKVEHPQKVEKKYRLTPMNKSYGKGKP